MSGINNVIGIDLSVTVTPTVSTSAYTAGDQVGGIQTLSDVYPDFYRVWNPNSKSGTGMQRFPGHLILQSITILDQAEQSATYNLFFFNQLPTVASSDNAALNIADSEVLKCIAHYQCAPTYGDAGGFTVGSVQNINMLLPQYEEMTNNELYVVMSTTTTPTFAATDDLTIRYNFYVD